MQDSQPETGPAGALLLPGLEGRYRILGRLGEGGSSEVYRALDLLEGQEVALKVFPAEPPGAGGVRGPGGGSPWLAGAEFRLLASQSHPNIVRVLDYGVTGEGRPFFSMELLEGPDVVAFAGQVAAGKSLERAQILAESAACEEVLRGILDALDYLHRRGLFHLDLKPANLIVTSGEGGRPVAKLVDFGLSRSRRQESPQASGTAEYIAPERIRGESGDARSDLYSLGVILYEMLLGRVPFSGPTAIEVLQAHLSAPVPGAEKLPERYRSLVLKCLEKEPARRPPSAWQVRLDLLGRPGRPSEILPPFGAAFVGREEILRSLDSAVRASAEGTPRTVLLLGGKGSGKSRILRELKVRLQLEGRSVVLDSCRLAARRPAGLLAGPLRLLLARAAGGSSSAAPEPSALTGLQRALEDLEGGAARDAQELERRREGFLHSLTSKVLELSRREPFTLLLDEAEGSDTLTREAILWLLRGVEHRGDSRLLLVLASRDDDEDGARASKEIERAAAGFSSFQASRIEGLSALEVEGYLRQVLGETALPEGFAGRLHQATGGNVSFIEEYLKLLLETGKIVRDGTAWRFAPGEALEIPATVEDALARRLAGCEVGPREVLGWLAVLDKPALPEEIASLMDAARQPLPDIEAALGDLERKAFLAREGLRHGFAGAAARAVAYAALADGERRRRHGLVAARLLEVEGPSPPLEEIAHHLFHSEEPSRARDYLIRSGERARGRGAFQEAALHLSRALDLTESEAGKFDLLLDRQEVLGHLGLKDAQEADINSLRSLAQALGDTRRKRDAALREALYLDSRGRKREALALLEEAGERLCSTPAQKAPLLSKAGMLKILLSDFEGALQALKLASEHARAAGDRRLEAECAQLVGLAHYRQARYRPALEEMRRALALQKETGEELRSGALESNLGLIHFDLGDLEAAEERFRASLKLFHKVGHRRGEAVNLLNLGLVYSELGKFERALDHISRSLQIRRELGDRRAEGADLGNLAGVWIRVGRIERALPLLEEAMRLAREMENPQSESANESRLGEVELHRGNAATATLHFKRALALAREIRLPAQECLARSGLCRARLQAGSPAEARKEAEAAIDLASSSGMWRRLVSARALLAAVHLAEGDLLEAERQSLQAVEALSRQPGGTFDGHEVWYQRYRVLEARRTAAASPEGGPRPTEPECEDALRRAYILLREKADAFEDDELRQGYLENISAHQEISRLHAIAQARVRREATARERSFHEIAKSLHSILEVDPLLERLLGLAIETTHAEKGLITLKNEDGSFTIRAARGMAKESVDDATDICRSVIADVAKGGGPVLAADASSDDRFRERRSVVSFHIKTLMCAPMVVRDEIIGAAYVDGRGAASFDSEDLEYLVSFAQLAAIAVENARLLEKLRAENIYLRKEVETRYRFESLVGMSAAMEQVTSLIEKVARTSASVLICGETGTGKELVARAIHYSSDRRSRPFVTVDCGALPENLLESELFGHRRGAFSGAIHDRVGLFEEADGGTLFLDEITNTTLDLQVKLLRALQEGEIRRVGENLVRKVNVRIVAASNLDVRSAVDSGAFREDLYYRLNVVGIEVPPLRRRREDIPLLAQHFLQRSCARLGKEIAGFTEEGIRFLMSAPWRGNVRELENLIERAVILAEKDRLDAPFLQGLLPPGPAATRPEGDGRPLLLTKEEASARSGPASGATEVPASPLLSLEEFDARWLEAEKRYLADLVRDCGGNLAEASRRAGVKNRNTLISRLKKHGLR